MNSTDTRPELLNEVVDMIMSGGTPSLNQVTALAKMYPYFTLPAQILLKNNGESLDRATADQLYRLVAIGAGDNGALCRVMMSADGADSTPFYPDQIPSRPTTQSAIDTFLSNYGSTTPDEEALLEKMIFNPTPDYSQILAQEESTSIPDETETPADSRDALINSFIISQKKQESAIVSTPVAPQVPPEERHTGQAPQPTPDNSLLSASLAKIFIKQGHYQRAYEIITQLSLNYPEKSVYFADQLRYLGILIARQERKQAK